ncbi:MAG: hypothetical protein KDI39_00895 [Pseudomonadales bacterium]|nr:hypothetical protein [Pseudomonadales bacterium]
MTATDLYNELVSHGFSLNVQGGNLMLSPSSQLSQAQRLEIKQHKSELLLLLAANDPHPKGVIKPVLEVAAQSEPLKEGADLSYQLEAQVNKGLSLVKNSDGVQPQIEDGRLYRKSEDKQSPENLGDVLKTEYTAPNFRDRFAPMAESSAVEQQPPLGDVPTVERKIPFNLDNYRHLVTCNQCEHLSLTGSCSRLGKRVNPQAMRECDSFVLLKRERSPLEEVKPYTQDELNRLLNQAAKPLYHHLIDCQQCSLEDARYCGDGFGLGNTFDCLLLCFDDAADKRYKLMNQVIKARVSGRRLFESLFSVDAPPPMQTAAITRKCGNTPEYEAFINHWTACKVCKPSLARYCSEGQRLEKEANQSYS